MIFFISLWVFILFFKKKNVFFNFTVITFFQLLYIVFDFFTGTSCFSSFLVGDLLSMCFIFLSIFVSFWSVYAMAVLGVDKRMFFLFFTINFFLLGLFFFNYLIHFFVILEIVMIPIFLILGFWGRYKERLNSGYYFIFYSFMTPIPLLICIMCLISSGMGGIYHVEFYNFSFKSVVGLEMFLLMVGFLSKLPLFGFHIWLPKAHVDAPVRGSIILAGILLKIRSYGVMRFFFVDGFFCKLLLFFFGLGIVGVFFCGLMCVCLVDYKVIIAFSSVSHMSLSFGGLIFSYFWGYEGAFYIFLGHGLVSPVLFYLGGCLYDRSGTRMLKRGIVGGALVFFFFLFFFLVNLGFPPFINFLREVGVIYSIFIGNTYFGFLLMLGFIVSGLFIMVVFTVLNNSSTLYKSMFIKEIVLLKVFFVGVLVISYGLVF